MKLNSLAAALVLSAAALPTMAATCTNSVVNLGTLGASSTATFGNSFTGYGPFNDCYQFTLSGGANAGGVTVEWDKAWWADIDITSLTLSGGSLASALTDNTPGSFSFSNLMSGLYLLEVTGNTVFNIDSAGWTGVGYNGTLNTTPTVASPTPEPGAYAMMALGLGAVAWTARRRKPR